MWGKRLSGDIPRHVVTNGLKTWIEISRTAAEQNYRFFEKRVSKKALRWAVVKSNAYGHGLFVFSRIADTLGVHGFCVDAPIEGVKLRKEGITKPILVLGSTLPPYYPHAEHENITVTISSFDALKELSRVKRPPYFHIKIDTGMHRQGFYLEDIPRIIKTIKARYAHLIENLKGSYTHFASAKDIAYPSYTEGQFKKFSIARDLFLKEGYRDMLFHAAATGGALVNNAYHMNAVRVGIGYYGVAPSQELEVQATKGALLPILSWKTIVTETKWTQEGDFIGYDLTERALKKTKIAILPIGYWHGFPRSLSSLGCVLIAGKRARVLGRVSMDLVVVDVSGILCGPGSVATIIGRDANEVLHVADVARASGTTAYEFLTRINPLIERIEV